MFVLFWRTCFCIILFAVPTIIWASARIIALSDIVLVSIVNVICGGLITGFMALAMKWLDLRSQARAKETSDKVDKVKVEVEEVKKTTDGIIPRLVAAGKIEATQEERDRAAAEKADDLAKEAEILRRISVAKPADNTAIIGADPINTVATNVEVIKTDVKAVQKDVLAVKAEVTKEVREGVKQGIEESKLEEK